MKSSFLSTYIIMLSVINKYLVAADKEYYQYTQNTYQCGNVILNVHSVKERRCVGQGREKGKEG